MPFLAALGPFLAANAAAIGAGAGIAGAGATIGNTIYSDLNQPSQPTQPQANDLTTNQPAQTSATANIAQETANRSGQANLVNQQIPNLQTNLGDSVSPDYLNQIASQAAGVFGSNPGTVNPGGFNWLDIGGSNPLSNPNISGIPGQLNGLVAS